METSIDNNCNCTFSLRRPVRRMLSGDTHTKRWYAVTQSIHVEPREILSFSGRIRSQDVRPNGHQYHNCQIVLQINLRLMALGAPLGDAHTSIRPAWRPRALPIRIKFFGNELRVVAADRNCAGIVRGKG